MRRIESRGLPGGVRQAYVDGRPWPGTCTIKGNIDSGLKVGIWLDGQRVYDAQFYDSDGSLIATIPPQEPWVDLAYDAMENPVRD